MTLVLKHLYIVCNMYLDVMLMLLPSTEALSVIHWGTLGTRRLLVILLSAEPAFEVL
jgi:hypothetical protein